MAKQAITVIASKETFKNLSTFTNVKELNKAVRYYKEKFADQFTKSTIAVLDLLHKYSAKYTGVSFQTKNNIAKTLGVSRKTVQRACNALESLGIIKQVEMKRRSDMRQTSNAIQILPVEENVQQEQPKMSDQKNNISLKQNIKDNIRTQSVNTLPHYISKEFAELSSYYFQDGDTKELWRIATIHSRMAKLPSESFTKVAVEGLKTLVGKCKQGKLKSVNGYFNGIIKKITKKYQVNSLFISVFEG